MEKIFRLSNVEVDQVEFKVDFISDRQYNNVPMTALLLERVWVSGRMDMFWIECKLGGEDLYPLAVEASLRTDMKISTNWCKVEEPQLSKLKKRANLWFKGQPEYRKQEVWLKQIHERLRPYGGLEEWRVLSFRAYEEFMKKKIAVCEDYRDMFESKDPDVRKKLNSTLRESGVYRNSNICVSGIEHMEWVYKTYVKNNQE